MKELTTDITIDLSNALTLSDFLAGKLPEKQQKARDFIVEGDMDGLEKYLSSLSDGDLEFVCEGICQESLL